MCWFVGILVFFWWFHVLLRCFGGLFHLLVFCLAFGALYAFSGAENLPVFEVDSVVFGDFCAELCAGVESALRKESTASLVFDQ